MSGKLIVARHAVQYHPDFSDVWLAQVQQFVERIESHLPSDPSRAIVLTSPKDRAAAVARHLQKNLQIGMEEVEDLSIGKSNERASQKILAEMKQRELVIAIGHEPNCPFLAMNVWREFGMRMISRPSFEQYMTAIMIDPSQAPDFAWEWTYL